VETNERLEGLREESEALADLLGTRSVLTLPLVRQGKAMGRMFLASDRHRFYPQDVDFLRQIVEHIAPVIENIRLLDRLATEAAEQERQKISRDLHDSAVQPYIGLKLGLDALARKVAPGDAISADIEELIRMASEQISDLRSLVGTISRGERKRIEGTGLVPAVRRHAAKFTEFYHIEVDVRAPLDQEPHDVGVDCLVTEDRVRRFRAAPAK
jgi:signal transduction histidine kinase